MARLPRAILSESPRGIGFEDSSIVDWIAVVGTRHGDDAGAGTKRSIGRREDGARASKAGQWAPRASRGALAQAA